MITLVSDKSDQVAELCRKFNVLRLDIFGSAATGDFSPEKSDLDFLVEYSMVCVRHPIDIASSFPI